jgi:hypothetical protein
VIGARLQRVDLLKVEIRRGKKERKEVKFVETLNLEEGTYNMWSVSTD